MDLVHMGPNTPPLPPQMWTMFFTLPILAYIIIEGNKLAPLGWRPEGSTRWPKATSPPQELDVGAHRALYLLVNNVEDIKR